MEQAQEALTHILTGYLRQTPETTLAEMEKGIDWQAMAQQALERRAARLIEAIDSETLLAIAKGDIDVLETARQIVRK